MKRFLIAMAIVALSPFLGIPFAALNSMVFDHTLAVEVVTGDRLKSASQFVCGMATGWWVFGENA